MPWCEECGAEVSANAKFCANCGRAVAASATDPTPTPPGADTDTDREGAPLLDGNVPGWLRDDWPAAAVAALIVFGVCLAVGVLYGAAAGLASTNKPEGAVSGMLTGAYLPFAMFGVETTAIRYAGDATLGFNFKTLPMPLAGTVVLGMYIAMRFAWPRINRAPTHLLAFVGKLAGVVTMVTALLAALLSFGGPRQAVAADGFAADVSVGTAAVYPFVIVVIVGVALLTWRKVRVLDGVAQRAVDTDVGRGVRAGALAFLAIASVLAVVVLIADVAVAEPGRARSSTLVAFFATGINRGIAATVFAMGGAVERLVGHTSLFDWGSYEHPGAGTAPLALFAWVGLAPAAVAYATLRSLDREGPDNEQGVARVAAAVVVGFVITSAVLVVATGQHRVAAGSPRAGFGLALLWGLLAASASAALWARSHNVRWHSLDAADDGADAWRRRPVDKRRAPTEAFEPPEPPPTLVDPDA